MSVVVIGIDSGLEGGLVALRTDPGEATSVLLSERAPTVKVNGRTVYRVSEMRDVLRGIKREHVVRFAVLEKGGVRPRVGPKGQTQGASAAYSAGYGFGLWEMALCALEIPYETPTPQVWQREMYRGVSGEGKERSVLACDRLLPFLDLRPGRCVKPHLGIADAGLLALYAAWRAT